MRNHSPVLLLLLAACGDVTGPGGGGGGGSDGGPDGGAPADAAVPGTVTVTVLSTNGSRDPVEDAPVVFFEPDGSVADTVETDADGVASAEVLPGGAVMVFTTNDLPAGTFRPEVWAVVGVVPGDDILLGGRQTHQAPVKDMTISLPPIKASPFFVSSPCGPGQGLDTISYPVTFYSDCDASPTSVIAYAMVGESRYVVTQGDIEVEHMGSAEVEDEWELVPAPDVTIENIDDVRAIEMEWARAIIDDDSIPLDLDSVISEVDSDQLTLSPEKVVQPDHVQLQVSLGPEQLTLGTQLWHISREGAGDDEDLVLDADDYRMPWIGAPVYDGATRVFSWPQVGDGDWDATYVTVNWNAADGKVTQVFGVVRVVAPPGHTEFVLPPVPEEYQEWLPPDIDTIQSTVVLFDSDQLDWDGARQLGNDPSNLFQYADTLTVPATLRYATSLPFGD